MLTMDSKEKEIEEVIRLRDENNLTFKEIASKFSFSERTARRRYQVGIIRESIGDLVDHTLDTFPSVDTPSVEVKSDYIKEGVNSLERFKPMQIVGDAIVSPDWHIPLHDTSMVNILIGCAKKEKIDQLIIPGDFFHMENFGSYLPHQPEAAFEVEREEGNKIMKTLLRTFDCVYLGWGNHDYRLTRALGYKHSFSECMKWMFDGLSNDELSRVILTDLDYMIYKPTAVANPIRVCHPTNFSAIPLTIPRKLAMKYSTGVLSAHSHHLSLGIAPNGKDLIMEAGGLFSKEKTEYIQRTTANHEWVSGFIMFKFGQPHLISKALHNTLKYEPKKEVTSNDPR